MAPEDLTSIDVSRLDALAKLEADERAIRVLSEKAAWRRDKEIEVYSRVMNDYEARMTAISEQAGQVRQRVRDDLEKLETLYHRYREALDRARVQLQECEFRYEIGEFTDEEFQRCQQAAERTIGEREVEFESVRTLRQRFLELLPGEPVAPVTPVRIPPAPAATAAVAKQSSVVTAAAVPPVQAVPAPATPAVSVPATGPTFEERSSPATGMTNFMRPPSATDFKVPSRKLSGDTEAFGTMSVSPAMLIEDRGGLPGTHHRLGAVTTLGRTPDNKIVVHTKEVSRRHAEIVMAADGYLVKDLGSPNGTFVNGERITEHRLKEGDKVSLGGKVFVFKEP
jgi:FHA domain